MANVNVNIRANMGNARGMNAAQRGDAAFEAQVALAAGGGGMRVGTDIQVRGGGVRAQFAVNDSYGSARTQGFQGSLGVTGMGDLSAQVTARYGGRMNSFQFEAKTNRANMQVRLNAGQQIRNQANIAVNMGVMQPNQAANLNVQMGNFNSFAQFQMGGVSQDAMFQQSIAMMQGQQQMQAQLGAQGNMLQSLGMADQMFAQQFGAFQGQVAEGFGAMGQAFSAFQGQVGNQFGQINQALGEIGKRDAGQDQMLQAHTNGLGQLTGDLMGLGTKFGSLSGVVDGLGSKLGALDGLFTNYRTSNDASMATLKGSTDTRFSGVDAQIAKLLGELNGLKTELAAARKETTDLRGTLGTETVRLDTKIDTLAGRVEAGFKDVKGQMDTAVSTITARLDKEIAALKASDSALKTELTGQIAGLDTQLKTAVGDMKTQLEAQKKELSAKLDTEVKKLEAVDAKLAADLKSLRGEYESFAKQTQSQLAVQSKRIDGAYAEINATKTQLQASLKDLETKLSAAITAGDAKLQAQLNDQKTQITNVMVQVNKHEVTINAHEATLKAHSSQITATMSTATQALNTAKDAKGLAEGLQGQVNTMKKDINQLQANDASFSALLGQWWKALEGWHGSHFLVNQGMQGNAHIRFDPIMLKKGGGTFGADDFGATATTNMVTGADQKLKWPTDTANIGALVLNPAELAKAGYKIMDSRGDELTAPTLFRDGLRLQAPDGTTTLATDGWSLMAALDSDKDGKLTKADPAVNALAVWFDAGETLGKIDGKDTLTKFTDMGIAEIGVTGGKERTDKHGNTFSDGNIKMTDGSAAAVTDWFAGQG